MSSSTQRRSPEFKAEAIKRLPSGVPGDRGGQSDRRVCDSLYACSSAQGISRAQKKSQKALGHPSGLANHGNLPALRRECHIPAGIYRKSAK